MAGIVFLRCLLFLCSFLAHNNTPLCKIYLLALIFFISAPLYSAKRGKEKSSLFFNYYRSGVNILHNGLVSLPFLFAGLRCRRITAAPVLSPRSCRVGSHIRLVLHFVRPYMTTDHADVTGVLCALSPLARFSSSITSKFNLDIQQRGAVTLPFRP